MIAAKWLDEWEAKLECGERSAHQTNDDVNWRFYSDAMDEISRLKQAMDYYRRNPYGEALVRVDFLV